MRLYDCATEIRSKNAGPFLLTIDIILADKETFQAVLNAPHFTPETIASLYGVPRPSVQIIPIEAIRAIKVTFPNPDGSSGSLECRDLYGSQQHFPLAGIELEDHLKAE